MGDGPKDFADRGFHGPPLPWRVAEARAREAIAAKSPASFAIPLGRSERPFISHGWTGCGVCLGDMRVPTQLRCSVHVEGEDITYRWSCR